MVKNGAKQLFASWYSNCDNSIIVFLHVMWWSSCRAPAEPQKSFGKDTWQGRLLQSSRWKYLLSYIHSLLCCSCAKTSHWLRLVSPLKYIKSTSCMCVCIHIICNKPFITVWIFTTNFIIIIISLTTVFFYYIFMHITKQSKCKCNVCARWLLCTF